MKIYFAGVRIECLDPLFRAHGKNDVANMLFSYYDLTDKAPFKFRRKSWEKLTGRKLQKEDG